MIVFFARCRSTNRFLFSLTPLSLRQDKALEHLKKTSEKRATLPEHYSQETVRNQLSMST